MTTTFGCLGMVGLVGMVVVVVVMPLTMSSSITGRYLGGAQLAASAPDVLALGDGLRGEAAGNALRWSQLCRGRGGRGGREGKDLLLLLLLIKMISC